MEHQVKNQNKKVGKAGEDLALNYLLTQNLILLERNFQIWGGELDLIMKDKDEYVFVEVKARYDDEIPFEELVSLNKIRALERTAEIWLAKHRFENVDWRFDFVGVDMQNKSVHWIKDCLV